MTRMVKESPSLTIKKKRNDAPASLHTLPQEIQDMILPLLTLHDLTSCIRVCHAWSTLLLPHIWTHLHLGRRHGLDEVERSWRKGYARFRECAEAGSLRRCGAWIRTVDTTCCSIVDVLLKFAGGSEGEEGEEEGGCRGLRELQVFDQPCPDSELWREDAREAVDSLAWDDDDYDNEVGGYWCEDDVGGEDEGENYGDAKEASAKETVACVAVSAPHMAVPRAETNAILALLRQNPHLRILKLGGEMMSMIHDLRFLILDAIPASIEHLELWDWRPASRKQEEYLSQCGYATYQRPNLLPTLPCLKRLVVGRGSIEDDAALVRILERCPNLETLCLHDLGYMPSYAYQSIAATIRGFCIKLTGLHLINCAVPSQDDLCLLLDACHESGGLKDFGFPCPPELKSFVFAEKAARALLRHSGTLENVRLDGCTSFPSELVQELLCSAQRLRRFDAMSRFRFSQMDVVLDAKDIVRSLSGAGVGGEEKGWVCLGLESFKCRIGGVPRPDILTRTNGRPLTDPLHTVSTSAESLQIQQQIYTQLSRLTDLRELVLGHHEVNMNYVMFLDEMDTEGEYYDFDNPAQDIQGGYQYECLDMRLQSGMKRLKALKALRRIEVEAMAVGFFEESEQKWVEENWKKLDWNWRDRFWSDLGYADYY
ncbi:hypothetical protein BKA57DRAFT_448142 [Linnemannia elongata]|nr:hypothetical protein BKA57DRAFT_448142 [Linnemannia elongata]